MIWTLFKKECRTLFKSLIFWLYVLALCLFFFSQMGTITFESKPEPGQEGSYGYKLSDRKEDQMSGTLGLLAESWMQDSFTTAPVGFTKKVTLNEEEKEEIASVLTKDTGLSTEEIQNRYDQWEEENTAKMPDGSMMFLDGNFSLEPKEGLDYEEFLKDMDEVCEILGPGSDFTEDHIRQNAMVEMTYEDALKEYENLVEKDGLTGGYARLFCDYMGIILAILPVFVAATREIRDKRASMQELIYTRKASSYTIIFSRYAALCFGMFLPVLLLSFYPLAECIGFAKGKGIDLHPGAFALYSLGWLLPTILVVTALGMFVTELTQTAAGVLVQAAWWFFSVFSGEDSMGGGNYGMNLIPRHNTELNYSGFHAQFSQLVQNRVFYAVLALALVVGAAMVFEARRKGRWGNGTLSRGRKRIRPASSAKAAAR
nr:ABC transporter permease [uncultured Sellimonas sp.]